MGRGRRRQPHVITGISGIRVLASPFRQAIIDTVAASGPMSVVQLSELLGRPADRLYYHVKQLARVGLLIGSDGTSSNGRPEARFDVPGTPIYVRYDVASPANRRAVGRVVASMLRAARRDFNSAFAGGNVEVEGPRRNLWAGRVQRSVTSGEVAEANILLSRLLGLLDRPSRPTSTRSRLHQLTWVWSPVGEQRA